jgi:hypothetical protein
MSIKKKFVLGLASAIILGAVVVPLAQGATVEELTQQMSNLCQSYYSLTGQVLSGCESYVTTSQTGVPSACSGVTFTRTLKLGSRGNDVKCLQALLNRDPATQIATSGAGSPGHETTYFGSKTKAAVIKYQEKNLGLAKGTGVVGSLTRAKLTETLVALSGGQQPSQPSQPSQPQVGAPLTVALASDTPAAGNILIGEANKVVTKITFNAASDADTTITGLKVKSFGTADLNNRDIAVVKIYDGTKQVGLNQQLVNGYAYFTFAPAITIPKGTSKTLSIVVSMRTAAAGTATPSATVKMGIESASDISGATFTGTFPIVGNTFTEVAGGALGTINVALSTPVPVNNVSVGQKDVVLGNLVVSAGTNEDVRLTQIVVQNNGGAGSQFLQVQDTDITNVRVKVDGVLQGTSSGFTTRRAVIDFTTPITITRGTSKTIQIIGDISSGAGRVIELNIPVDAVSGVGATSGVGIAGPNQGFDLGATNRITIGPGQLAVSVSTASPQGSSADIIRSTVAQVLGVYDIRAIGEDVIINTIGLKIGTFASPNANVGGTIGSVALYDENGALLSNMVDLAETNWDNTDPDLQIFNLNWTVPKDTTKKLYIKGVTNGITFSGTANNVAIHVQLAQIASAGNKSIIGTGLSSSGESGPNNVTTDSQLALPNITINKSAQYAAVGDPTVTPRNQAVLGPSAQVLLGSLRVTASREDQNLRALSLVGTTSAGNLADIVSSVALFDGDTQVTTWKAPANNDVVFNPEDIITPTTFVVNTPKTLKIVGNMITPGTGTEGTTVRLSVGATASSCDGDTATIDCLQTLGRTSGQITESANGAIDLRVNSGGLGNNTGGVLTLYSSVMWAKKNASSPSGTINRNSRATLATWDFGAVGTDDLEINSITFTSLAGGLTNATHTNFMLYDEFTGTYLANSADSDSNIAGNQVTFSVGKALTSAIPVTRATGARLSLKADITSSNVFATGTQIQMSIREAGDVDVEKLNTNVDRGIGITSSTNISIPADAGLVTVGSQ